MKLILVGCEYSGTTTLALRINNWLTDLTGAGFRLIHDHWKLPHTSGHLPEDTDNFLTPEEQAQVLGLSPKLKEMHQRHSLYYHTPNHPSDENKLVIGYTSTTPSTVRCTSSTGGRPTGRTAGSSRRRSKRRCCRTSRTR